MFENIIIIMQNRKVYVVVIYVCFCWIVGIFEFAISHTLYKSDCKLHNWNYIIGMKNEVTIL